MDNFRKKENRVDYARRRSETPVTVIFQLRSGFAPSREDCTFPPVGKSIYIYIFYIVEKKVSFNLAGVHSIKRTGEVEEKLRMCSRIKAIRQRNKVPPKRV